MAFGETCDVETLWMASRVMYRSQEGPGIS